MNSRQNSSSLQDQKYASRRNKPDSLLQVVAWIALIFSLFFMAWSKYQVEKAKEGGDDHLLLGEIDIKRINENMIKKMANITFNEYPSEKLEFNNDINQQILKFSRENFIKTVADFGCGKGQYVKNLREAKIDALGYDSTSYSTDTQSWIQKLDLSQPVDIGRSFDMVISINVGEYIFSDYQDNFIKNLAMHSKKYIFLSWGALGEVGYLRVNNRENSYIINKLEKLNFAYDGSQTDKIRSQLKNELKTIMIFKKK